MRLQPYYDEDGITIYHGDCREVLPEVLPTEPQVWLTDPPYSSGGFQEAGRSAGSVGREGTDFEPIYLDQLSTRGYMNLMRDALRHSYRAVEIGVFTDWRMWGNTTDALEYAGFVIRAMLVWAKESGALGRPWRHQHELIAFGMRLAADKDRVGKSGTVLSANRSGNNYHTTEKPISLLRKILDNMTEGVVVDPFMGSGTTLRAAKDLDRRAIGIEVNERYCEIAVQRLAQGVLNFGESEMETLSALRVEP